MTRLPKRGQMPLWTPEQPPPITRWEDDREHYQSVYWPQDAYYQKDRGRLLRRLMQTVYSTFVIDIVYCFAARRTLSVITYQETRSGLHSDRIDACIARILFAPNALGETECLLDVMAMDARSWHMVKATNIRSTEVGGFYDRALDEWYADAIRHPEEARAYLALGGE